VALLYVLWNKKSENKECYRVYRFYLYTILLSIPLGLSLEFFKSTFLTGFDSATFAGSLTVSIVTAVVFVVMVLSAGYVLGITEIKELLRRILTKIKK
jgi:hypothetical protein